MYLIYIYNVINFGDGKAEFSASLHQSSVSHSVTLFKEKFKRTAFVGNYNCVNKSLYLHTYDITCNINIIFNINIKYFCNFKYPS